MNPCRIFAFCLLVLTCAAGSAPGNTYLVKPDGTGDFPTIQDAINAAAAGDLILLADGVFIGTGNRNIDFKGKAITIRSKSGSAQDCIIDAQGVPYIPNRGFDFKTAEGNDSVLQDITIKNGTTDDC